MDTPHHGQKTALVTGVGVGGIGGHLALELHKRGFFVFCAARRPAAIDSLLRDGMVPLELDVTSSASVAAAVQRIKAVTPKLDVLVNNAGQATHRPSLDFDVDGVVAPLMDVNVLGPMRMVNACAELLISAKGCVVNIGSIAPIMPLAFSTAYNASKAALHAYGDALSMELKPLGVDVVTVMTGGVKSNIVRDDRPTLPAGSFFRPVEKYWLGRVTQSQTGAMATDVYARGVVDMLMKKKRPLWYWRGAKVWVAWLVYYFVPKRLKLFLMARRYGLTTLGL